MTLNKIENAFFELLRIALGTQDKMTVALNDAEWKDVAQMAVKQSVLGILFTAVETLPEEQRPYNDLYIDMYKWVDTIEQRNEHMNKLTASVSNRFRKDGFPNCILKGQGVALLYPKPLRRHSGDIDIWVKGKMDDILSYVTRRTKPRKTGYLHIEFQLKNGTPIEAHFRPSFNNNFVTNHKLQKWFKEQQDEQNENYVNLPNSEERIPIPTHAFNSIFILHHIYRHFFGEGIGLRQLIDYFYVLKALQEETPEKIEYVQRIFKDLDLSKFASSIMWIFEQFFFMDKKYLLLEPNAKEGEMLLSEVLIAGNFGKYDERKDLSQKVTTKVVIKRTFKRTVQLMWSYPGEALSKPFYLIWLFFWRRFNQLT